MMKYKSPTILFYTLLRVMPITLLLMLLVGVGIVWLARQTIQETVDKGLQNQASQAATLTAQNLQQQIYFVEALAKNDLVINGTIDTLGRTNYLEPLFQSLQLPGPNNFRIVMVDYQGRTIVTNQSTGGYEDSPWLDELMSIGKNIIEISPERFLIVVPILYIGRPEGALVIDYPAEAVPELFGLATETGNFVIVDEQEQVLFASNPQLTEDQQLAPIINTNAWLFIRETVPNFPTLTLISAQPTTFALQQVNQLMQFMIIATALNLFILGGGLFLTAQIVKRPLTDFSHQLQMIRYQDDLNRRITLEGTIEFEQLAETFNHMMSELQTVTVSRDYVDNILKSMNDLLIVIYPNKRIRRVNPAVCKSLQYSREELLGQPIDLIMADGNHPLSEETLQDTEALELYYQCKDTQLIPMSFRGSIIYDRFGEIAGMVCVARDITALKQARLVQEQLQQEIVEAQQNTIRKLSTPIIPIIDEVIVVPLIGNIDAIRAQDMMRAIMRGVQEHGAAIVIIDITGVPVIDTDVAGYLDKTMRAAQLKGARTIVTGVSPAVAETIVDLGIDWHSLETVRDLKTGLNISLRYMGVVL